MFTSIRIDGQNFVVMPEKEFKSWVKQGFSLDITGSRPLSEKERQQILDEMSSDKSKGITSKQVKLKMKEWAKL